MLWGQILPRCRAKTFCKTRLSDPGDQKQRFAFVEPGDVAKSTTGQQPRAIHSTTHLQRVREGCAGSAAVRRRKLTSLARASSKLLGERAPPAIAEQQDCSAALAGHAAARNAARCCSEVVKRRGRSPTSSRPRRPETPPPRAERRPHARDTPPPPRAQHTSAALTRVDTHRSSRNETPRYINKL